VPPGAGSVKSVIIVFEATSPSSVIRILNMPVVIADNPPRNLLQALGLGFRMKCPNCGIGPLFTSYLKVAPECSHCGEELHHHRADDAPPYFTILVVGHVIIPMVLALEMAYRPALWIHAALWLPMTLIVAMSTLPLIKGALVGHQWALYMHGFDPRDRDAGTSKT
jgi:uncharacterized protein (DUF983 family)